MNAPSEKSSPLPLSAKARRTQESPLNALIAAKRANPELVNCAAGLVDEATLPVAEVAARTSAAGACSTAEPAARDVRGGPPAA